MEKQGKKTLPRLETFIGKATLAIDAAGRTSLPKEFRKVLHDENRGQVVVTVGENRPTDVPGAKLQEFAITCRVPLDVRYVRPGRAADAVATAGEVRR